MEEPNKKDHIWSEPTALEEQYSHAFKIDHIPADHLNPNMIVYTIDTVGEASIDDVNLLADDFALRAEKVQSAEKNIVVIIDNTTDSTPPAPKLYVQSRMSDTLRNIHGNGGRLFVIHRNSLASMITSIVSHLTGVHIMLVADPEQALYIAAGSYHGESPDVSNYFEG